MAEENDFDVVRNGQALRDYHSTTASEIARKLNFLGFGLIALFGGLNNSTFRFPIDLPNNLVIAGALLTSALVLDLAQYVYGTIAYGALARFEEKKREERPTAPRRTTFPPEINWPTLFFFYAKLGMTAWAWVVLLLHLARGID